MNIKAVKMAKSGDTFDGACQWALHFIKDEIDIETVVILAGINNLSKKNCTPKDLADIVLKSVKEKSPKIFPAKFLSAKYHQGLIYV